IKRTALITMGKAIISLATMGVCGYFFGIAGVAAGAGVGALFSLLLAARMLAEIDALTSSTLVIFARESFFALSAVLFVYLIKDLLMPADTWLGVATDVVSVTGLYSAILLFCSARFRAEIRGIFTAGVSLIRRCLA
ncbi:porin, partial [bacterium]|nr:porin [bacterium]